MKNLLLKNVLSIYQSKKYLNIFTFIRKCKNVKVLHTTFFSYFEKFLSKSFIFGNSSLSDVITAFVLFENNNNGLFNFMDYPRIFEYLLELNIKKLF